MAALLLNKNIRPAVQRMKYKRDVENGRRENKNGKCRRLGEPETNKMCIICLVWVTEKFTETTQTQTG